MLKYFLDSTIIAIFILHCCISLLYLHLYAKNGVLHTSERELLRSPLVKQGNRHSINILSSQADTQTHRHADTRRRHIPRLAQLSRGNDCNICNKTNKIFIKFISNFMLITNSHHLGFLPRDSYAKRNICRRRVSVCVCVCVCLSNSGIVSKWLNI